MPRIQKWKIIKLLIIVLVFILCILTKKNIVDTLSNFVIDHLDKICIQSLGIL